MVKGRKEVKYPAPVPVDEEESSAVLGSKKLSVYRSNPNGELIKKIHVVDSTHNINITSLLLYLTSSHPMASTTSGLVDPAVFQTLQARIDDDSKFRDVRLG